MGAKGKAVAMFGIATGAALLYAFMRGVGLKHMAERISVQIVPNLAQIRIDGQFIYLPVEVKVDNRSREVVPLRVNSVKLKDGNSEIADVAASTGAKVYQLRGYSSTRVPMTVEIPMLGKLMFSTITGVIGAAQKAIAAGRAKGAKNGFVELLGDSKAQIVAWVNRLSAVVSIEADSIALSVPLELGGGSKEVNVTNGKATVDGLGLAARTDRPIAPLADYVHLIPPASLLKRTDPEVLYGTTGETAVLIRDLAKKYKWHTTKLAKRLRGKDLNETLGNIYRFIYTHIAYEKDSPTREEVRLPLRTLYDQRGDCDCYATLIASMLENLGIKYKVRLAGYHDRDYFQHVYIVVPTRQNARGYYVVDPVVEGYNNEEPYTMIKDY